LKRTYVIIYTIKGDISKHDKPWKGEAYPIVKTKKSDN
jgi:hypothetical protein